MYIVLDVIIFYINTQKKNYIYITILEYSSVIQNVP